MFCDSKFLNGLLIPSSISPGSDGQVLSSDRKNTVWKTPAITLQIHFKMFYGPNLDPPLVFWFFCFSYWFFSTWSNNNNKKLRGVLYRVQMVVIPGLYILIIQFHFLTLIQQ